MDHVLRIGSEQREGHVAEGLITPDQLRRITEEKEMEKARQALEKKTPGGQRARSAS
jgi:hypothetical protein